MLDAGAGIYYENILLHSGVALYGGFAGDEKSRSTRNWTVNQTIIDGGGNGSVVTVPPGVLETTRIDGFTIRNGMGRTISGKRYGGGISCYDHCSPTIANCVIVGNSSQYGGGISCLFYSDPVIRNTIITGNGAYERGGGIDFQQYSKPWAINATIVGNSAPRGNGGGISSSTTSSIYPRVVNSIVAFNSSGLCGNLDLQHNCVYRNGEWDYLDPLKPGGADLGSDPLLVSTVYGNLHIQPNSPCVDTGFNEVVLEDDLDMDGQSRAGSPVDIGADESDGTTWTVEPTIIRVTPTGNDANDGSSWELAKRTVQAGIDAASAVGGEVWVKAGIYKEHIRLLPFAYVYGGFKGAETVGSKRNWSVNQTVLDGSQTGTEPPVVGSVVTAIHTGYLNSAINGFVITNGIGTLSSNRRYGGGIFIRGAAPVISNNVIMRNNVSGSSSSGAGIYCYGSSPRISNNLIFGNASSYYGGGVSVNHYSAAALVNNTLIENNAAIYEGGGGVFCNDGSFPLIANCIIAFGSSGIRYVGSSGSTETNNLFHNCVYENRDYNYSGLYAGKDDKEVDPLLVDRLNGDYHLRSKSPCKDNGDGAWVIPGEVDIDGQARTQGLYTDIGADEWAATPPVNRSFEPAAGSVVGKSKVTVTSKYSDNNGYDDISNCYLVINTVFSGSNALYVRYDAGAKKLYLRNDANTAWLGGYTPGAANVIENGYGKLYCADTTVSGEGSTLTINWKIELKSFWLSKTCGAWMLVTDSTSLRDGWDKMGSFKVIKPEQPPVNVSLTPADGTLATLTPLVFTTTFYDPNGYANLRGVYLLMNTSLTGANGIYVCYSENLNKIYLRDDVNRTWLGGFAPGSANVIENSQCKLYCAETTVTGTGNQLVVNWKIEIKPSMAGKSIKGWLTCFDDTDLREAYDQMGSYSVGP